MTKLETYLAQVKERAGRATKGPWEPCGVRFSIVSCYQPQESIDICDTAIVDLMTNEQATHNANFIAHSRTDVEKLLTLIKRYRAALTISKMALVVALEDTSDTYYLNVLNDLSKASAKAEEIAWEG